MGRWKPGARERIARAALELYAERGFDRTTVTEIADRADLTERTFFRHFADKREVLFSGQDELAATCVDRIAAAPESSLPLGAVAEALRALSEPFEERREFARQRQAVVTAHAGLRERELLKLATLASATADALRRRGVGEPAASVTAEAGVAVFKVAFGRWIEEGEERTLSEIVQDSVDCLGAVMAPGAEAEAGGGAGAARWLGGASVSGGAPPSPGRRTRP